MMHTQTCRGACGACPRNPVPRRFGALWPPRRGNRGGLRSGVPVHKDAGPMAPPEDPGNPTVNFHGESRRNDTHQSTTDPEPEARTDLDLLLDAGLVSRI